MFFGFFGLLIGLSDKSMTPRLVGEISVGMALLGGLAASLWWVVDRVRGRIPRPLKAPAR